MKEPFVSGARCQMLRVFIAWDWMVTLGSGLVTREAAAAPRVIVEGPIYIAPDQTNGSTALVVMVEGQPAEQRASEAPPVTVPAPEEKRRHVEPLRLVVGPLLDEANGMPLPGEVSIEGEQPPLTAGEKVVLRIKATGIHFEGTAQADVLNYGERVSSLRIHRAPLAVQLEHGQLRVRERQPASMTLRNDTHHRLHLRWRLQFGASQLCGPSRTTSGAGGSDGSNDCPPVGHQAPTPTPEDPFLSIEPMSKTTVDFTAPVVGSSWFDRLSTRPVPAVLWLGTSDGAFRRDLKIEALVEGSCFPGETLWVVMFLLAGALMSLLVRHWVPNLQRKREIGSQLRKVELRVDDFSAEVSSLLREQTRSECKVLRLRLNSRLTIMPDYTTVAVECESLVNMLAKRTRLIEKIDAAWTRMGAYWDTSPPPTQVDRIEGLLKQASDGLSKVQPSQDELALIERMIDTASELAGQFTGSLDGPSHAFGKDLLDQAKAALANRREPLGDNRVLELTRLREILQKELAAAGATDAAAVSDSSIALPVEAWARVDYTLRAIGLWKEYVWMLDSSPAAADPEVRAKLASHLQRHSWNELHLARLMLKEMRENSADAKVEDADPKQIFIDYEPRRIKYPQVVNFRIRFRRDDLNWSAARHRIVPEWSFCGGSSPADYCEQGSWEVSHLFADRRRWWQVAWGWIERNLLFRDQLATETVRLRFRLANGLEREPQHLFEAPVTVDTSGPGERRHRLFTEIIALLVSIAVPLLSLIAGAKEKLSEDPVGGALVVFLLGFSSDTVVSVFKQRAVGASNGS